VNPLETSGIPPAFSRKLATHNLHAAVYAAVCAAGAAFLWSLGYLLAYWLVLLGVSAWQGIDAEMPERFAHGFAAATIFLLLLAAVHRRHAPEPPDGLLRRGFYELLLAPARATWAALANLRAICVLRPDEREAAWVIAAALAERQPRPISELPVLVPEPALRERALLALQLAEIVALRPGPDGWAARLGGEEARRICDPSARLRFPEQHRR